MDDRSVQRLMAASGYYSGGIDGQFGPKSWTGAKLVLERNAPEALKWSEARQKVAVAQVILNAAGYEPGKVDGYSGDLTQEAFNAWDHFVTTGKVEIIPGREATDGGDVPTPSGVRWPSQAGVRAYFGEAGSAACTAGKAVLPIPFRLAWNKIQLVHSFACHAKVAAPLTTIYGEAVKHYGEKRFKELGLDLWGGCYNYRKMRGGTALSMHAYGIAVDHDPERNQLRWGHTQASFARDDYNPWWKIVEAQGAISLGRERDYDWMHFQFATL